MFERTAAGISNRRLFFGVDIVLYTEGQEDERQPNYDRLFWSLMFRAVRPDLRVHCIPRGSKQAVLELVQQTAQERTPGVFFAVDSDYDGIDGTRLADPRVLYTFGYSFESDVFNPETTFDTFWRLYPFCPSQQDCKDTIVQLFEEFYADVTWFIRADHLGHLHGFCPLDRERPAKYLDSAAYEARPKFSRSKALADVRTANASLASRERKTGLSRRLSPSLIVGHLVACFARNVITYVHSRFGRGTKLSNNAILTTAIGSYTQLVGAGDQSVDAVHYRRLLIGVV